MNKGKAEVSALILEMMEKQAKNEVKTIEQMNYLKGYMNALAELNTKIYEEIMK